MILFFSSWCLETKKCLYSSRFIIMVTYSIPRQNCASLWDQDLQHLSPELWAVEAWILLGDIGSSKCSNSCLTAWFPEPLFFFSMSSSYWEPSATERTLSHRVYSIVEKSTSYSEFCLRAGSLAMLSTGCFTTLSISVQLLCGTVHDAKEPAFMGLF